MSAWEGYQQHAYNFQASLYQSLLIYSSSRRLLKNFPNELPPEYQRFLNQFAESFSIAIKDITELLKDGKVSPSQEYKLYGRGKDGKYKGIALVFEDPDDYGKMVTATIDMLRPLNELGVLIQDIDFTNLSNGQQLITIFAFLESFISDSIRSICKQTPDILRRKKLIEWETIVSAGNYEDLISHLADKLAFESGHSVTEKIATLKKEFVLDIKVPDEINSILEQGELLRNLVAHNGGRVSIEYKRKSNTNLRLGESVFIADDFVEKVFNGAFYLAKEVFGSVAKKYFAQNDATISNVFPAEADINEDDLHDIQDTN